MRLRDSLWILSLVLPLCSVAPAAARSQRAFSIPQVSTPERSTCRFEFEQKFTSQRKATDTGGDFFEHSMGYGCHVYAIDDFDLETGFDYIEAHDIRATNVLAPVQFNVRATYGARDEHGWSMAIGVDGMGVKTGENNFNVFYALAQHRVQAWQIALGGYTGNGDVLRTSDDKREPSGALFGFWRVIGRGRVGAEWQSGQNRLGYTSLGAEVNFDERLTAALAYAIANDRGLMRDWVFVRLQLR